MPNIGHMFIWYIVFVFSVTLHEAAHAWLAMRGGDFTAYMGGQVSLNPVPHIRREPFGMLLLPLISLVMLGWPFGYASAPYDPTWGQRHPRRAAWMALAGPASNFLLVILTGLLIRLGLAAQVFTQPESLRFTQVVAAIQPGLTEALALFLSIFFTLNLVLTVLNLMPFPPLDGSQIIPLFLPESAAQRYQAFIRSSPFLAFIGLFLAWKFFSPLFRIVFITCLELLYPGLDLR